MDRLGRLLSGSFSRADLDDYYTAIKNERHLFVFGVCGRTSTTAFQRIVNSTNQLNIWGEPGDYVIDNIVESIMHLESKSKARHAAVRRKQLQQAFRKGRHNVDYAMAFRDMAHAVRLMRCALAEMLRPVTEVNRFGFKEIRVRSSETLRGLRELFPNAEFIFLFRDPRTQWPSVRRRDWVHWKDLKSFLGDYAFLAETYIGFSDHLIEDKAIKTARCWDALLPRLHVSSIDRSLINDGLRATRNAAHLTGEEVRMIETSRAFALYKDMVRIARKWLGIRW